MRSSTLPNVDGPMDEQLELKKFKQILFAGTIFLVASISSCREFKYAFRGETTDAEVTRVFETEEMRGRGRRKKLLAVEYTFTDAAGREHSERDDVPISTPAPQDTVRVQYLPGVDDSSRLAGRENWFAVCLFFGGLAWLSVSVFSLVKEANEPIARSR